MTVAEKTDLFGFLTTAGDWISGYKSDHPVPEFTDSIDEEEVAEKLVFSSISDLQHAVLACSRCPLASNRIIVVPGEGTPSTDRIPVLVIGPAPGGTDGLPGRPFAGNGGALLDKMLAAIKLTGTENCYLTNLVKCMPSPLRNPEEREVFICSSWLDAQIELLQPVLILALGRASAQHLLRTNDDLESLRGTFYSYQGIPLLSTYHPDDILADESLKRPVWEDLKLFRSELDRIWHNGSK